MTMQFRKFLTSAVLALSLGVAAPVTAKTLSIAFGDVPQGLDGDAIKAYTQPFVVQAYDPLVRYKKVSGADGKIGVDLNNFDGALAESWTVDSAGTRWVFKLREGVRSSYGNELTAEDVVWSWNKSFAQKRTGNFIASVTNVEKLEAVSKYEVAFVLKAPSSLLLPALTLYVPGIYDSTEMKKHATAEDPWGLKFIENHTAGFGPYTLEQVVPGQQAVMVANPNYYGNKPEFDRVVVRAVPSGGSRLTLLKSGQVHYIERPTFQQVSELMKDKKVTVEQREGKFFTGLWFNTNMAPFDDIKVRQAINHAIDRKTLVDTLYQGLATQTNSIAAPYIPGSTGVDYAFDPERAKTLLKEAGKSDLSFEVLYADAFPWMEQGVIQLQAMLKNAGVTVNPRRVTNNELRAAIAPDARKTPAFLWEDGPFLPDAVYTLSIFTIPKNIGNKGEYSNPRVTELAKQAMVEQDPAKRAAQVDEGLKLVMGDAPYALFGIPKTIEVFSAAVNGYVWYPDEYPRWADLKSAK